MIEVTNNVDSSYLESQDIGAEVEIFLQNQHDGFPKDQLEALSNAVLYCLDLEGRWFLRTPRLELCYPQKQAVFAKYYQRYLWRAWIMSLQWARGLSKRREVYVEEKHMGSSYGFICLHALYFPKLPVYLENYLQTRFTRQRPER